MGLDDFFNYGLYRGMQLSDVIENHPGYIVWCCEQEIVDFDEEALELISKKGIV